MTTMFVKHSFRSAFTRPVFLILLVLALLMAPASAFASGDDDQNPDSSPTTDQTTPTDQSGGSEESTSTEQFESPTAYEQDATASSGDIDAGLPEAATSPSQPDDQSEPVEVIASAQTETADTETGLNGTSDTGGNDPTGEQEFAPLETVGTAEDDNPASEDKAASLYFQVQEVSMSPLLNPGSIIEIVSETYADGDMVVAQKSDGTYIVKVLNGDQLVPLGAGESYNAADVTILGAAHLSSMTAESLEQRGLTWHNALAQTATQPSGDGSSGNPYLIASLENLYWITASGTVDGLTQAERWAKHYLQTANIDASATSTWNSGSGWEPIGIFDNYNTYLTIPFSGIYNGNSKTISNLSINRPTEDLIGLFGYTSLMAELKNIGTVGITVTGNVSVGGLVGLNTGTITNSHTTGAVTGNYNVGGLVGYNTGTITDSYASGTVTGEYSNKISERIGGLVGSNYGYGTISNSHASVDVNGYQSVGGLVGLNYSKISNSSAEGDVIGKIKKLSEGIYEGGGDSGGLVGLNIGQITDSYASGNVDGFVYLGGLVGHNNGGTISNSYASGNAYGYNSSGGLVGYNSGEISNSYASGNASALDSSGGLVGYNSGEICNSYASGNAGGWFNSGGLVGYNYNTGNITNSYWDTETSGKVSSAGGTGKSTIEMQQLNTFKNLPIPEDDCWSISDQGGESTIWRIYEGSTYPLLRNLFSSTATITITAADKIYDGTTDLLGGNYTIQPGKITSYVRTIDPGPVTYQAASKNAGEDEIILRGVYSNQLEYDLIFETDSKFTITACPITVTAETGTKVYDGNTSSSGVPTITTGALVASDSVTWTQTYDNKNVGTSKVLTPAGTVNDGNSGNNYAVTLDNVSSGVITACPITVTAETGTKVYDGNNSSSGVPTITTGALVASDSVTWTQTYDNKNVGTSKVLTPAGTVNDGNSGNNYVVTIANDTTGVITARGLILSNFVAGNKVYDGTTDVTGAGFIDDRLGTDVLTFSYNAAFLDKNVGTGKNVNFTGIVVSGGADAGNYNLLTTSGTDTADITPKSLVITATDITKLYYSTYTFTGTEFSTVGLVSGDEVTFAAITSAGAPKTALPGDYVISIGNAVGTGLHNYDITYVDGTMSVILPTFESFDGFDTHDLPFSDPFTTPAFSGDRALTVITGGVDALITPAFVSSGNQFELAQALLAYQAALQRYEEEKALLSDEQKALIETELTIARAAILVTEARFLTAKGLPYNLAALQAAYAEAVASLNAHQSFLSAGQLAAANQLLAAIAGVIAMLQQINA